MSLLSNITHQVQNTMQKWKLNGLPFQMQNNDMHFLQPWSNTVYHKPCLSQYWPAASQRCQIMGIRNWSVSLDTNNNQNNIKRAAYNTCILSITHGHYTAQLMTQSLWWMPFNTTLNHYHSCNICPLDWFQCYPPTSSSVLQANLHTGYPTGFVHITR